MSGGVAVNTFTLTLTPADMDTLRTGYDTLLRMDNHGRQVALFPQEEFEATTSRPLMLTVVLSKRDLDLIELSPDGHEMRDTTGMRCWTIQVEAS